MEDARSQNRPGKLWGNTIINPINKLEEEGHKKRREARSKVAMKNRTKKLTNQMRSDPFSNINNKEGNNKLCPNNRGNYDLRSLVRSLYDKDLNVKAILIEKWKDFRNSFKEEMEEDKDSSYLIDAIDWHMNAWDPSIAKKPFYDMVATDKIIYWWTIIMYKIMEDMLKKYENKEQFPHFKTELKPWSDFTEEIKMNNAEMSQNIQKEITELKDKVEKLKNPDYDWRDAFVHNKKRFRNGVVWIEQGKRIIRRTVYWDSWVDRKGKKRSYYYIKEGVKYMGFRKWFLRNKKKCIMGRKQILQTLKELNKNKQTKKSSQNSKDIEMTN